MNERVKELFIQKFGKRNLPKGNAEVLMSANDLELFAELIVRECIDQCADIPGSNDEYDKGIRWAANQIQEHFGVE